MSTHHGPPPGYYFPRRARSDHYRTTPAGMRMSCIIAPGGHPIIAEGASRRFADRAVVEAAWAHHRERMKAVTT